jgi:ATP-dependent RNA helicase DDX54/DBP10
MAIGCRSVKDLFSVFIPNSIVATPGRFLHVLMEMDLKLSSVEYVVFDEADRYVLVVVYLYMYILLYKTTHIL